MMYGSVANDIGFLNESSYSIFGREQKVVLGRWLELRECFMLLMSFLRGEWYSSFYRYRKSEDDDLSIAGSSPLTELSEQEDSDLPELSLDAQHGGAIDAETWHAAEVCRH